MDPKISNVVNKAGHFSTGNRAAKVWVVYTGGTIGMVKNDEGMLVPKKRTFETMIRSFSQMHDKPYYDKMLANPEFDTSFLVLPETKDLDKRIFYKIYEYDNLLDSSNMAEIEWRKIAEDIMEQYESYDGFVVLHGTDTLPYTASALSFMFESLGKGIVVTGSQIPIFEPRSDGVDNFVSSLIIAGGMAIPEVTVFFNRKLFRGNRTRKISADSFGAFDSPNFPPLVTIGVEVEVNRKLIAKTPAEKCNLHAQLSRDVGILRIYPTISREEIGAFCQLPKQGVVLETYGAGNMPTNRPDIFEEIKEAVQRGVIFVNITQCIEGLVAAPVYETGKEIADAGVIPGYDMTPEAAFTKLSYVVSKTNISHHDKIKMMTTSISGELTNVDVIIRRTPMEIFVASLGTRSPVKTMEMIRNVSNGLLVQALQQNDVETANKLIEFGADVCARHQDGKTVVNDNVSRHNGRMFGSILKYGIDTGIILASMFNEKTGLSDKTEQEVGLINAKDHSERAVKLTPVQAPLSKSCTMDRLARANQNNQELIGRNYNNNVINN